MVTVNTKYARLNKDAITKLQELEKETGKIIIAFEPTSPYAELSQDQLQKVQQLEKDLGIILIAYNK